MYVSSISHLQQGNNTYIPACILDSHNDIPTPLNSKMNSFSSSKKQIRQTIPSNCVRGRPCKALFAAGILFYLLYFFLSTNVTARRPQDFLSSLLSPSTITNDNSEKTNINHIVFGIIGSAQGWKSRGPYNDLWWRPNKTRGYVWLDHAPSYPWPNSSPPYRVSEDTSKFRAYDKHGMPFAVRMTRVLMESYRTADMRREVRWVVMVDDDTLLFVDNLVGLLGRHDHKKYYYLGGGSECIAQNYEHSFGMAFGGAGVVLSFPLAKAFAGIVDDCLKRYPSVYGDDLVIESCVSEIGVSVTREPGFHQMDLKGDVSGLLSAHPQAPLLSFHHLDHIDPIFPSMTRIQSLQHLFKAENADSSRLLQQNVCYDKSKNWSLSISWGYSFQIYESILPPSLLQRPIQTFGAWKKAIGPPFMFNTRPLSSNPCEAPHWFFFDSIEETAGGSDKIVAKYVRRSPRVLGTCAISGNHSAEAVSQILVLSPRKRLDYWVGRRRECCEVGPTGGRDMLKVRIRACMEKEAVA